MGGSIAGPLIAGGMGLLGGMASGGGKGAQFMPPTAYMSPAQRAAFEAVFLNAMQQPTSIPITYGGKEYSLPRQFPVQAAAQYGAAMRPIQTQGPQPSEMSGALMAMAGMMPWLMNQQTPNLMPYTYRPTGITNPPYSMWDYE